MTDLMQPNHYNLSGDGIEVTYSQAIDERWGLRYHERGRQVNASGKQLRTQATELGTEVTVTLQPVPFSPIPEPIPAPRRITFTLLVPGVNLTVNQSAVEIVTAGIETTSHTSLIGPVSIIGLLQQYRIIQLNGTASIVRHQ